MFLHIAMYLRLSQEDVDKRNNVLKDESNSIRSQRLLIQRYIQEHSELSGCPVMEFVDDGYTGTNFDRPQFQKMISLIRRPLSVWPQLFRGWRFSGAYFPVSWCSIYCHQ